MIAAALTVSSTPVRLVGGGSVVAAGLRVLIKNTHATDKLIIGGLGVAATTGSASTAGRLGYREPRRG
jgi:hypothetical protein